jgi:hypothetical protein
MGELVVGEAHSASVITNMQLDDITGNSIKYVVQRESSRPISSGTGETGSGVRSASGKIIPPIAAAAARQDAARDPRASTRHRKRSARQPIRQSQYLMWEASA